MNTKQTTDTRQVAEALGPEARELVLWAAADATGTEPAWLRDGQDPGPALEARRAGCVNLDVYAVTPTPLGRRVAALLAEARK